MNKAGLELIKRWEGLRLEAYLCPANVLTIGYGHTSMAGEPRVFQGMTISKAEATKILRKDMVKYEEAVRACVKVKTTDNQHNAMSSLCMNIGQGGFKNSSVVREINKGNYDAVPGKFALWNKATVNGKKVVLKGLVNRRADEANLFMTPDSGVKEELVPDGAKAEEELPKARLGLPALIMALVAGLIASLWDRIEGLF